MALRATKAMKTKRGAAIPPAVGFQPALAALEVACSQDWPPHGRFSTVPHNL